MVLDQIQTKLVGTGSTSSELATPDAANSNSSLKLTNATFWQREGMGFEVIGGSLAGYVVFACWYISRLRDGAIIGDPLLVLALGFAVAILVLPLSLALIFGLFGLHGQAKRGHGLAEDQAAIKQGK